MNRGSSPTKGLNTSPVDTKKCLSSLLEQDFYLWKVLGCLVKEGLHECRRVCRKWNEVCKDLSVELSYMMSDKWIQEVPKKFPKTVALSCWFEAHHEDCSLEDSFRSLTSLHNIRKLTLEFGDEGVAFPKEMPKLFQSMTQLQCLCLLSGLEDPMSPYMDALRALTNLSYLALRSETVTHFAVEPYTELQKLDRLSISVNLLTNASGDLLFPTMKSAHDLQVDTIGQPEGNAKMELEMIAPCAANLTSLAIFFDCNLPATLNWPLLKSFTKLDTLTLSGGCGGLGNVTEVLKEMRHLTSLDLINLDDFPSNATDVIVSLTGLRSLCFSALGLEVDHVSFSVSRLTQLTRLQTQFAYGEIPFLNLTRLVKLDLVLYKQIDLSLALSQMTLLENLTLTSHEGCCVEDTSTAFSRLKKLKFLMLEMNVGVNREFFSVLHTLPDLSFLSFGCMDKESCGSSITGLTLLTNLRELHIHFRGVSNPLKYISHGSLSKLRTLGIHALELSMDEEHELLRRLPCLNRLHSCDEDCES